ncbi:MAG: dockerin type I repeat-containing protein [Ruminococcus sp.]|nr:dockerin type I repeat-containing protein [Ruminococcus sp.]
MKMKKLFALTAALMMTFGSAVATYADTEQDAELTGQETVEREMIEPESEYIALDELYASEFAASSEKVDAKQNALAKQAIFKVSTYIKLKDGSSIPADFDVGIVPIDEGYAFTTHITIDEIKETLSAAGKSTDDFSRISYSLTANFKKDLGIDDSYRIRYQANLKGAVTNDHGSSGYASVSGRNFITKKPGEVMKISTPSRDDLLTDTHNKYLEDTIFIDLSKAIVYKPTKAHLNSMKLTYTPTAALIMKDGTELATNWKFNKSNGDYEDYVFTLNPTISELESTLKKSGKKLDDLDGIHYYLSISNPSGSGIDNKSTLKGLYFLGSYNKVLKDKNAYINGNYGSSTKIKAAASYKVNENKIDLGKCDIVLGKLCTDGYEKDDKGEFVLKQKERDLTYDDLSRLSLTVNVSCYDAEVSAPSSNGNKTVKGDANGDKKVDVTDIAVTASHIKGIKALTGTQFKAADVDGDGKLTVTDIAMIASHIKGIKALK